MKLFYRKYGDGPPLIILHGLYGSSDNWVTIAKNLSDSFTVYLPDQRNHGRSAHSNIHDYDSMSEDLYELVNDLKIKKFFLAGHSMGGKSAITFALKWPELIYGLLIADISPFTNENDHHSAYDQHNTILSTILSMDLFRITSRGEAEKILSEKIHDNKIKGFILKNLERTDDNKINWKLNASGLLQNLDNILKGIDRKEFMSQIITGFPVIFLQGELSDYLPDSDFRDIRNIFPAAEFVKVPRAGHWIHADRPDEVVKNLKRLLTYS
jgi:esterase